MYDKMTSSLLLIIVSTVIVIAILWTSCKEGYGGMWGAGSYKTLATQYNNPLFTPCISKRCSGGPYTYTNNPYLQAACQGVDCMQCRQCMRNGYYGKPAHFRYSSLSDDCWGNALCNTTTPSSLCIL